MMLTKHFNLAEMCNSQTAARLGLDNTPSDDVVDKLRYTCAGLELIRLITGCPIVVTSGYRSPAVNHAVGGKETSQHCRGEAADITAPAYGHPVDFMDAIISGGIGMTSASWSIVTARRGQAGYM
jgi:zinc D-Ala-D-Ala carboxypeptidase